MCSAHRGPGARSGQHGRAASAGTLLRLSPREVDVLHLLASGKSNKEIAAALGMSVRTLERHIANLYAKIDAVGRADAIAFAHRHGLL
jgi:DNA-binding CsgD family transcriptional regulator